MRVVFLRDVRNVSLRHVWPLLTCTALAVWSGLVSGIARALVGPNHVHTFSISAQIVTQGTLIDIYKRHTESVFYITVN